MTDRELEIMSRTRKSAPQKLNKMGMVVFADIMWRVLDGLMMEMGYRIIMRII